MRDDFNNEKALDPATDGLIQAFDQLLEDSHALPTLATGPDHADEEPGSCCPGVDQWLQLALGDAQPDQRQTLFTHAADCKRCAAQLRLSLNLLKDSFTHDEEAELQHLQSSTPAWRHQMAVELAQTSHKKTRKFLFKQPLWMAALATSLLLTVVVTYFWRQTHTPERLLAQAYTHERNLDLRMPGAEHAPMQQQNHLRGAAGNNESAWLLDAHARIRRGLETAPNDMHLLQLEARADVLEEKYDVAIDILDRLIASGPVTSLLLTDGASAYYQRGAAIGSESDRATALDYLRRADELSPDEPVVLFNEAIVLEDRGQVMNAVETWNRFLRFEHDAKWLAEGRERLAKLEQKLTRLKTHESRMRQLLADPDSMRALAANPVKLSGWDEELSVEWLPELLNQSFVAPTDRSRGSPCDNGCQASRQLLYALAASLQTNHQDPWLSHLLPPLASLSSPGFVQAAHDLVSGLEAVRSAKYSLAIGQLKAAGNRFQAQNNQAGADLAQAELSFAYYRLGSSAKVCYQQAHPIVGRHSEYVWIQLLATMQEQLCDTSPGVDAEDRQSYQGILHLAQKHQYVLQELRARNLVSSPAVVSADVERVWQICIPTVRKFWGGDYPAYRLFTILSGIAEVEAKTPRNRVGLLLQREVVATLSYSYASRQMIPGERLDLVSAAIRAGAATEARDQMQLFQDEIKNSQDQVAMQARLSTSQLALARLYTARHDFAQARQMLDSFRNYFHNNLHGYLRRDVGVAEAELELASGKPSDAEQLLLDAIQEQEFDASTGHAQYVSWARQQRESYAAEAGLWLAKGRPAEEILALWERYRLRILDLPAPSCNGPKKLICLQPKIAQARKHLGDDRLIGQIVLADRSLIYEVDANGVHWSTVAVGKEELTEAAMALERVVNSPASSQATVNQAAQRLGKMLFANLHEPLKPGSTLVLESDPMLGNLPWPAVETTAGTLGLQFDLVESPSLAREPDARAMNRPFIGAAAPLVVGASWTGGVEPPLPEVINEVKSVARFYTHPDLLIAQAATAASVTARMELAPAIHFAGHANQHADGARLLLAPTVRNSKASEPAYIDSAILRRHPPRAARLVVFSACATGKRDEGWNNGIGDIVNTLAGLGVPDVVATRWQIDSSSAATVMSRFYERLAQGASVPHAMTTARQALAADARYHHPYYWAAYYVSGLTDQRLNRVLAPAVPGSGS